MKSTVLLRLLLLAPLAATAAPDALPLLPADLGKTFLLNDSVHPEAARATFRVARQEGGDAVFVADNPKGSSNYAGVSVRWPLQAAVKKGDVILLRFSARALKARQESGEAEGLISFQRGDGKGERVTQAFSVGPDWTDINVPFRAAQDSEPGAASVSISYATLEQTFELRGVRMLDYGQQARLEDLPVTRFSYAGREDGAVWRSAALQRIERLRTAPLSVRVLGADGKPVRGARVQLQQTRSAFLWGSAVSAKLLLDQGSSDAEQYRAHVKSLFDTTVLGNDLKWPEWRQPAERKQALQALDWLAAHGKRIKGHNLAWTAWKFTPGDIARDPQRCDKIDALVGEHIADITAATRGKLIGWDVVNEPLHETDYFKCMPQTRVADWFKQAAAGEPGLQLTVNEYAMLNRSSSPLFIAEFRSYVDMLRQHGARVDVLGVQGHVGQTPRPPAAVLSDLDLLAQGGNQVQLTEFDFNTPDEALQADYTRDFLIAVYSHPAVTGFIQWGFWQGDHWKPDAAMFRRDWSEKPNARVWRELVLDRWKTKADRNTGDDGSLTLRAHQGDYAISAEHGGRRAQAEATLGRDGATVELRLR